MNERIKVKLEDIKISETFANSIPNENKMVECREFWRYEGKQDRPIVLNKKNTLIDGYVMYLILKEHKEEYAEVTYTKKHNRRYERLSKVEPSYKNTPTTYIFGVHPNSNCSKEFVWRVPASWGNWADNIEIGDTVLCQTKFGFSPVIVNRVKVLDKPPVEMIVKKVVRREIRRNGMVVEF